MRLLFYKRNEVYKSYNFTDILVDQILFTLYKGLLDILASNLFYSYIIISTVF